MGQVGADPCSGTAAACGIDHSIDARLFQTRIAVLVDIVGTMRGPRRRVNAQRAAPSLPLGRLLYRFSARHDAKAFDALLAGYSGYLVADAHAAYDHLYRDGAVTEVACWSHSRRYWFKALESDPDRAKLALSLIGELFRIGRTIADAPRKKREPVRSARSKPVLQKFFEWCPSQRDEVLDESPVATAIGYAPNQRAALSRFLDDGRLPVHHNLSELNLRRQVLGRRNWLFLGSEDGALANTTFVSLLASARLHDIEPLAYIRDLLCLLPSWPRYRVLALTPAYWKKTLEEPETQQKLNANVFRRVTLGLPPLDSRRPIASYVYARSDVTS